MRTALVLLLLALSACRYQPEPVPMIGSSGDLERLAGSWEGEYIGRESQRIGIISFTITAHGDSAFGHVLLTEDGQQRNYAPAHDAEAHLRHAPSEKLLHIAFVQVRGGRVRGEIEPYIAPDCQCVAITVFNGTLEGDRITGTFTTRREWGSEQGGTWAVRKRH